MIKGDKTYKFDRNLLVGGKTSNGNSIPDGGVLINNSFLAGYLQEAGGSSSKWRIIGKVSGNNINHIPKYSLNNEQKAGEIRNQSKSTNSEPNISLKTAVKMLRHYYRNNFN